MNSQLSRKVCPYGSSCYRKNKKHLKDFSHPSKDVSIEAKQKNEDNRKNSDSLKQNVNTTKRHINDFFTRAPKKLITSTDVSTSCLSFTAETDKESPLKPDTLDVLSSMHAISSSEDESSKDSHSSEKSVKDPLNEQLCKTELQLPVSGSCVISDNESNLKPLETQSKNIFNNDNPEKLTQLKQFIKEKFLLDMPDDFYQFWNFALLVNPLNPAVCLYEDLGLKLVGPFDVLADTCICENSKIPDVNFLTHWRYFYDPPEFTTVLKGSDSTQFHMGYFRDDPKEMPCFVASNEAASNCTITPRGPNIFAAISWFIDEKLKKNKAFSNSTIKNLKTKLEEFCSKNDIGVSLKTSDMKSRDKKVLCKTFHGAGMVVPVDSNEVGYRPVPETPAGLKRMFQKIVDSKDVESRNKNMDALMEIIMLVQFANDECDYGEGLELGLDLFSYGNEIFHSQISKLLPLAYQLLGRDAFSTIIQAHLKDRSKSSKLNKLI